MVVLWRWAIAVADKNTDMVNPFLQRARPYPVKLIVDIHSQCNARCVMCPYPKYSRQQSQGVMEWPLYTRIVDEMGWIGREAGFRPQMTYCYMAEPFLADDLGRYVAYARQQGVGVYLNTNAQAMTPEKLDGLLDAGFSGKIHVSFHGASSEVFERITGLDYEQVLSHTLYLLERYDHERVCIRGVDDRWPKGERRKWFEFWSKYDVQLEYLPPISRCGAVKRLLPDSMREKQTMRLYGCRNHLPLVEMVILFDGRAVMCCQDMGRELIWGDVGAKGIAGVWNGPTRKAAVERLYNGSASDKSFLCRRCEKALGTMGMVGSLVQEGWRKLKRPREAEVECGV